MNNLYFILSNKTGVGVFYDPDDDLNNDGVVSGGETNHLTYTANYYSGFQSILQIDITNQSTTFTPLGTGIVSFTFTASDGYSNVTTDPVLFNVTFNPVKQPTPIPISRNVPRPVFYQIPVDKIVNLDIITPKSMTLYDNNTLTIPVELKNEGNDTLYGIELHSTTSN